MPLFYFHIVADTTFLDDEGSTFADSQAALLHARQLAAELAKGLQPHNGTVVVENEDDGALFEVPVASRSN